MARNGLVRCNFLSKRFDVPGDLPSLRRLGADGVTARRGWIIDARSFRTSRQSATYLHPACGRRLFHSHCHEAFCPIEDHSMTIAKRLVILLAVPLFALLGLGIF